MNKEKKKEDDKALIEKLNGYFDTCRSHYSKVHKKMKLLDATDSGELWKALNAKFPHYQILPDTNFVSYIKSNLLASIFDISSIPLTMIVLCDFIRKVFIFDVDCD